MKFYLAPMEDITNYVYRNAYHKYFEPFDKYFLPFISPNPRGKFAPWEREDILPEHNSGMYAVPQILTNDTEEFIQTARTLESYGYREVNLNLGCPSKGVVAKFRGAGFLAKPEELDCFLNQVFEHLDMKISVKTRIGRWSPDEFEELLEIYNQYPLEEVIIHPRVQKDYYKNEPDLQVFEEAIQNSKNPVCYNGNIFTAENYDVWKCQFPQENRVMIGRGILYHPDLIGKIKDKKCYDKSTYQLFHDELFQGNLVVFSDERSAICKMKEIWSYLGHHFVGSEPYLQQIRKANTKTEYEKAAASLFRNTELY